jgi:ubiquinone/menaquinone biosynthesis C-methylase UbiE
MSTSKATRGYKGIGMEGPIATWYSKITLKDVQRHKLMAAKLVKKIPAGAQVLEIAPGPGYFCIELARLGSFQITGLDISKSFVEIARKNAEQAGFSMEFRQGDAANMPFKEASFDFMFCQAAFKNFSQPAQAIAEMYRCLRPGGTAIISDLKRDASRVEIDREVDQMHLGWWDAIMTRWTFHNMLLKNAYTLSEMKTFVAQTPFTKFKIDTSGIGFQLSLEK